MTFKHRFFGSGTGPSPSGTLNMASWKKIGKGALYAAGGAVVAYLLGALPGLDLGKYTVFVLPLASIALNAADKFFRGN